MSVGRADTRRLDGPGHALIRLARRDIAAITVTRSSPRRDGAETRYIRRMRRALPLLFLAPLFASCSSKDTVPPDPTGPTEVMCKLADAVFEAGDPTGHADPLGAAAAKQARAGRIGDAKLVPQPAHGRQRIEAGDYLIINDKLAVVIENKGLSYGYARFGGEILSVDRVGADGKPMGLSLYGETLMGIGIRMIDPTSVTVLHDGSDGGEAVVRVTGPIQPIPFLDGPLRVLFPRDYELQMAYDYVLKPGSEAITPPCHVGPPLRP